MSKTLAKKSTLFYFGFSAKMPLESSDSETEIELPTVSVCMCRSGYRHQDC